MLAEIQKEKIRPARILRRYAVTGSGRITMRAALCKMDIFPARIAASNAGTHIERFKFAVAVFRFKNREITERLHATGKCDSH